MFYELNIKNPLFSVLGYIKAVANVQDKHDRSAPSDYHWKILKCRMLIFSNSSILACPDKEEVKKIHIIFNKIGDDYDRLNSLLLKFSLAQAGAIEPVTPEIYQMSFQYTMIAKLAPMWNMLGINYLVNNRDFLTAKEPQEGIKYQILSQDQWTTLQVKPVKINLTRSNNDYLPGECIRVLPSLNKATVEENCHVIPKYGIFKCYKDLRRHWKNIGTKSIEWNSPYIRVLVSSASYLRGWLALVILESLDPLTSFHGACNLRKCLNMHARAIRCHRLPDDDDSSYCLVRFWRGEPLTYPKICVTRSFPIVTPLPKHEEKKILKRFINTLQCKMPSILGSTMMIHQNFDDNYNLNETLPETQAVSLCTPTQVNPSDVSSIKQHPK